MSSADYFHWNPSLYVPGSEWQGFGLRWYGVLFALGLLLCAYHAPKYFERWGLPKQHAERLCLWVPIGMLLGAHYIHLIFYETDGLFDFSFEVRSLVPLDVSVGRFWALGSGLASHGAGVGCVIALYAFWHLYGKPLGLRFHRYADATMMAAVWVFPWVRLGNFMNSEIVGRVTDSPWGVVFERAYGAFGAPRHPVQLYEAALYFVELALAVLWFQPRYARKLRPGAAFYLFLLIHFSFRFLAEFFKDSQGVDAGWSLNMGHLLSLPIVLVCAYLLFFTKRFNLLTPLSDEEKTEIERSVEISHEYDEKVEAAARDAREPATGAADASKTSGTSEKKKSKKARS